MIPYAYECIIETYLPSFQLKIICIYFLHLWAILDNNRCAYYNARDTLNHYFVECESVRMLECSGNLQRHGFHELPNLL